MPQLEFHSLHWWSLWSSWKFLCWWTSRSLCRHPSDLGHRNTKISASYSSAHVPRGLSPVLYFLSPINANDFPIPSPVLFLSDPPSRSSEIRSITIWIHVTLNFSFTACPSRCFTSHSAGYSTSQIFWKSNKTSLNLYLAKRTYSHNHNCKAYELPCWAEVEKKSHTQHKRRGSWMNQSQRP